MAKILVIDDEEQIRTALCRFLTKQGHETQEADSGEVATDLCAKVKFDIILTDIIMPDKEGLETILELRGLQPEMKIIAMSEGSTFGNLDYLKLAEKLGADRSISKPFRLHEIKALVDDLLGLSPQADESGDSTS